MGNETNLIWAETNDVIVEVAPLVGRYTPGEYMPIGCPIGDVTVPRARESRSKDREGWCSTNAAGLATALAGKLTISASLTVEMDVSDPAYALLDDALQTQDSVALRVTATNKAATPWTHTLEYVALVRQADLQFSGTGPSRVPYAFDIQEVLWDWIGPAPEVRILGASWDKSSDPTLTRTDDAVGFIAEAGVGMQYVRNDFDRQPIFGEMRDVEDGLGNVFVRIPKFYVRKTDGPGERSWAVSKTQHPGFYLPACFYDFQADEELPYVDLGKYAATEVSSKLASRAGSFPLVNQSIIEFRDLAQANNTGGASGYQQFDVHAWDALRTLMFVEFATLDLQSVMAGWTSGRNSGDDTVVVGDAGTNRAIVANATAARFAVGQPFAIGSSNSSHSVTTTVRTITGFEPVGGNTGILFDGPPVTTTEGDVVQNAGWVNGFSAGIAASSGSPDDPLSGKHPMVYRGVENAYGSVYAWLDGVNITERVAWVAEDAEEFASNVFAEPYEPVGFTNADSDGYVSEFGFDAAHPFAEFPTAVAGSASTYYADRYYQATGQRVVPVGGAWNNGGTAGPSIVAAYSAASNRAVTAGARLLKKAL